jgi:hypothetical protein
MSEPIKPMDDQNIISSIQPETAEELEIADRDPVTFHTDFQGIMEMYSDEKTVTNYINDHNGWFIRCASPMTAEPFGDNGYTLIVGHYGAFGYEVEPQMSVILEAPHDRHYAMYSVPNPNFKDQGYEVDYRSEMEIQPIEISQAAKGIEKVFAKENITSLPEQITCIHWHLHLEVKVKFPKFIYRLPMNVIVSTGDRLLAQIIKQVSPHFSYKVQKDFHTRYNLPIPPKTARTCEKSNITK